MGDEYPTDDDLQRIREWGHTDFTGLMQFVRERWKYADCGYWTQDDREYAISTGGWSGNEELLGAMRENQMFWLCCWVSSRRGGHYEFELPERRGPSRG